MKYSLESLFQVIILQAADFPQHNVVLQRSNQANLELLTYLFASVPEQKGYKLRISLVTRQIQTPFYSL